MATVTQEFKQIVRDSFPLIDGVLTIEIEYIKDKRVRLTVLVCDLDDNPMTDIETVMLNEGDRLMLKDIRKGFVINV